MSEQISLVDEVEQIHFTHHDNLRSLDIEVDIDGKKELAHETTNFRVLFSAYIAYKKLYDAGDTEGLAQLKASANQLEAIYIQTLEQNWPTLEASFTTLEQSHPKIYGAMSEYSKRQNETAEERKKVQAEFGRNSREARMLVQQNQLAPKQLALNQKLFSMGLDGSIAAVRGVDPNFDINIFNQ